MVPENVEMIPRRSPFTIYPDYHDSRTTSYANPELYEWFPANPKP